MKLSGMLKLLFFVLLFRLTKSDLFTSKIRGIEADCSKNFTIDVPSNITRKTWSCQSTYEQQMVIKFNISSGLVFRLRLFYGEPYFTPSGSSNYEAVGRWSGKAYTKNYSGFVVDLWSQSGEVNLTKYEIDTVQHDYYLFYSAYSCNNSITTVNDCDNEINSIIAEAPPGLTCKWNMDTLKILKDKTWAIGVFGFRNTTFMDKYDSPSITIYDEINKCTLGQYYSWPEDNISNAVIFDLSSNFISLSFNSGSSFTTDCDIPQLCYYNRHLSVKYRTIPKQYSCTYNNESRQFCNQYRGNIQLEIMKEFEIKIGKAVQLNHNPFRLVLSEDVTINQMFLCRCIYQNIDSSSSPSSPSSVTSASSKSTIANTTSYLPSTTSMNTSTSTTTTTTTTATTAVKTSTDPTSSTVGSTTSSLLTTTSTTTTVLTTSTYCATTTSISPTTSLPSISNLTQINLTLDNVYETLFQMEDLLKNLTSSEMDSGVVAGVGSILVSAANLGPLNSTICSLWMTDINLLLSANSSVLREAQANNNSCSELLSALDELGMNAIVNDTLDYTFFYNGTSLSLSVTDNNCTYDIYKNGICQDSNNNVFTISSDEPPTFDDVKIYLYLPRELVCNENGTRVVFKVFNNLTLFVNESNYEENTNFLSWFLHDVFHSSGQSWCNQTKMPEGHVVSGSIIGPDNTNLLSQPATVSIKIPDRQFTRQELSCGFWNNITNTWDENGCNLVDTKNGLAVFETNHLTDFTLLVTVQPTDPSICNTLLNDFGFISSIVSTVSLAIVVIMLTIYMYITRKNPKATKKYFSSLCFNATFFAFFLVFTVASDQNRVKMSLLDCQISAAIMYTLLISVMFWILAKSLQFYKLYVVVFESSSFIEKLTMFPVTIFICVVVPIALTIGLWFGTPEFFKRSDQFCWIMPQLTLYGVVIPMTLLLVVNVTITLLVMKSLFNISLTRDNTSRVFKPKNRKAVFWRKVWILFAMQIVLCLPWVMQYFTFININLNIFHYFFTIFNGLQGLWIAIIFIYEHRKHILKKLPLMKTKTAISLISLTNTNDNTYQSIDDDKKK